jgi:RimJ/RimL family protein N-acetyltransferase
MWPEPVTLRGRHASLVPLDASHAAGLQAAVQDGRLWELRVTNVPGVEEVPAEIRRRLALQAAGSMLPFTVLDTTDRPVGMTTYMNIDVTHRRVEIGSTWYAKTVQRTGLNTECKRLLLGHAFESLGCIAVEFRTSSQNEASRRAIERLGARLDGILRHHMRHRDGSLRDTCVYSITADEWPAVRARLDALLAWPGN